MKKVIIALAVSALAAGAYAQSSDAPESACKPQVCEECGRAIPQTCPKCGRPLAPAPRMKKTMQNDGKRQEMRGGQRDGEKMRAPKRELTPEQKAQFEQMKKDRENLAALARAYKEDKSDAKLAALKAAVSEVMEKQAAAMAKRVETLKADLAKLDNEAKNADEAGKAKIARQKERMAKMLERTEKHVAEFSADKAKAVDQMVERLLSDKKGPRKNGEMPRRAPRK